MINSDPRLAVLSAEAVGAHHRDWRFARVGMTCFGNAGRLLWVIHALMVIGCQHFAADPSPRRPLKLTAQQKRAFQPRHAAFGLELKRVNQRSSYDQYRLSAWTYSDAAHELKRIEGEYFQSLRVPEGEQSPLLVVAPILGGAGAGYVPSRLMARYACNVGLSAFFLYQEDSILAGDRDGLSLEAVLRESVIDNQKALDLLLREREEIDPSRLGSLGISLGAIRNVLLVAVEPRLRANVLCMGGVDLAQILRKSTEPGVLEYVEERWEQAGLTREEVCRDVARHVISEPSRFAPTIATDRVLLLLSRFDDKVPIACGQRLRNLLGRPETYLLPVGHYTVAFVFPYVCSRTFRYLREKLGQSAGVVRCGSAGCNGGECLGSPEL